MPKSRIIGILKSLNAGMLEREEIIAVSLLAALAGQNTFLLGPPGTAKSLIARRISFAFSEQKYFAYLMQRFSTPEEVFGPVSIKELKEDNYVRKTEGFLPKADFAFLDEIWKAGPAILNTLLTIVNEKIFRNGVKEEEVPLKAVIAASNEPPDPKEKQGLEALYDRFIVRLYVPPMQNRGNFESLLHSPPVEAEVKVPQELAVGNAEWDKWQEDARKVEVSSETINVVQLIRARLVKEKKLKVYVSDRRWQKAMLVVKSAAFFCGRNKTNLADTLLLRHCLWDTNDNREAIVKIVEDAVKNSGFSTGKDFGAMFACKDKLGSRIKKALFNSKDIYATKKTQSGEECYTVVMFSQRYYDGESVTLFIPVSRLQKKDEFHPLNKEGEEIRDFKCKAAGQAVYISDRGYHGQYPIRPIDNEQFEDSITWHPKILFKKGSKKEFDSPETRQRLAASFRASVEECKKDLCSAKSDVETRLKAFEGELDSPFVPADKRYIALAGVRTQLDEIEAAIQDCDALNELASD